MATPQTDIERMIQELNQYILPSTLMESFDAYREENYKEAIRLVPETTLAWFLDMLNRYRGPEDRKESLLEVFDPSMYTENHPAWERPPGTVIELKAAFVVRRIGIVPRPAIFFRAIRRLAA